METHGGYSPFDKELSKFTKFDAAQTSVCAK